MPELAEVEIVRRNLERWWSAPAAEVVVVDPELVRDGEAGEAGGAEVLEARLRDGVPTMRRRGKHLIAAFDEGSAVVFHFRMTGKIVLGDPQARFARLAWRVPDVGWLVFLDPRRLGHVDLLPPGGLADYAPVARMGPEPHGLDGSTLRERVGARGLKHALLDQAVIAGVGNIAVSEVLWRLGLPPDAHASALSEAQWDALAAEMPRYFDSVIEAEQADEVRYLSEGRADEHVGGDGLFDVYGREDDPCRRCATPVVRVRVAGRSSYYCPNCQRG